MPKKKRTNIKNKYTMRHILVILCCSALLCGCKNKSTQLGTVEYYPSFLWEDAKLTPSVKTMDCDFSEDAKHDATTFAEFQIVDNDGKPMPTATMQVKVDGKIAQNNTFRITSKADSIKLEFSFTPTAEAGKYQGALKLIRYNLDRIDNQQLSYNTKPISMLQWTLYYDKQMNPLARALLIIAILIAICMILWFAFRRCFIPVIKLSRVNVNGINLTYTDSKKINRYRKVVFTSKKKKQSFFDKVFLGKIKYIVSDYWTDDWELFPGKKKKTVKLSLHGNYTTSPILMEMKSMDACTIISKKHDTKIKITIN